MSNIAHPAHEAKERISQALDGIANLHQTPDILMQWDLRRNLPWPLLQTGAAGGKRRETGDGRQGTGDGRLDR